MIGRTPGNIVAIRPLKDGVIADFDVTQDMLKYFIEGLQKVHHPAQGSNLWPSGVTEVEKRAVEGGHPCWSQGCLPNRRTHGSSHRSRPTSQEATGSLI